jgi:hypothetical protein
MAVIEAGAGGLGLGGLAKFPEYGIALKLPRIPLWVPDEAAKQLTDLVVNSMRLALQEVAGRISEEAPIGATGHLAQSFGADPANSNGGIELTGTSRVFSNAGLTGRVFSSLPYAIVMNQGRRAGLPISRAGIDSIGLWAQRKLGLSADEANEAKWAIASSIQAHGIEGTEYFDKGVKSAEPVVAMMFQILGDQIAAALVKPATGQ